MRTDGQTDAHDEANSRFYNFVFQSRLKRGYIARSGTGTQYFGVREFEVSCGPLWSALHYFSLLSSDYCDIFVLAHTLIWAYVHLVPSNTVGRHVYLIRLPIVDLMYTEHSSLLRHDVVEIGIVTDVSDELAVSIFRVVQFQNIWELGKFAL
jgi:hypothetical protein